MLLFFGNAGCKRHRQCFATHTEGSEAPITWQAFAIRFANMPVRKPDRSTFDEISVGSFRESNSRR